MRTIDYQLQRLAIRIGAGDHSAFRRLYTQLGPEILATVRADLPDAVHSMHVVRATFNEVWWMCAFDLRCGTERNDILGWIAAIAARRGDDRRQALIRIAKNPQMASDDAFWTGLIADHDQWKHFELVVMLDGHDTIPGQR